MCGGRDGGGGGQPGGEEGRSGPFLTLEGSEMEAGQDFLGPREPQSQVLPLLTASSHWGGAHRPAQDLPAEDLCSLPAYPEPMAWGEAGGEQL